MSHHFVSKLKRFIPLIALGFLALAVIMARRQFTAYHISHIRDLIFAVPYMVLGQAVLLTIGSYLMATCYDRLALRYLGRKLALKKTMLVAFISFAVSHNAGHSLVSGTSMRYRFYPKWGLTGMETIKITLVDSITYGLSLVTLVLFFYIGSWVLHSELAPIPGMRLLMAAVAIGYTGYWVAVVWWRPTLTIKGISFRLPRGRLSLAQMAVGCGDVFLAGMVLYTFLSVTVDIPLSEFFVVFVLSLVLGTLSQLPGGLGVFEGVFLHLLSTNYPDADLLAALVLYRIVYYFAPLCLAGSLLLAYEIRSQRHHARWSTLKKLYH